MPPFHDFTKMPPPLPEKLDHMGYFTHSRCNGDFFFENTIKIRKIFAPNVPSPTALFSSKINFILVYRTFFVTKKCNVSFQNTEPLSAFLTLLKKCPHSSLKIHIFRQKWTKIKFTAVYWSFFSLEFSRFFPKSSIKIRSFFFKNQIYTS